MIYNKSNNIRQCYNSVPINIIILIEKNKYQESNNLKLVYNKYK